MFIYLFTILFGNQRDKDGNSVRISHMGGKRLELSAERGLAPDAHTREAGISSAVLSTKAVQVLALDPDGSIPY